MMPTKDELTEKWNQYIINDRKLNGEIKRVAGIYPSECSIFVDWSDLDRWDVGLAEMVLDRPNTTIAAGNAAISSHQPPDCGDAVLVLRIRGLPRDRRIEVRDIRTGHQNKFIAVEAMVTRATQVRPRIIEGSWECRRCGRHIPVEQDIGPVEPPLECLKDGTMDDFGNSGCGRTASSTSFKLDPTFTVCKDSQKIEVQEAPEILRGAQPKDILCIAEGDVAGIAEPGDRVVLNGILRSHLKNQGKTTSVMDIYLEVNSVERMDAVAEDMEITPDEEKKIVELAKSPTLYDDLGASICPTIYGMEHEKMAIVFMLIGGVSKTMADGTKIRGESHVLMVGDPGVAKSKLLRYVADIAPRGVYASGKSSSGAGITATAEKDDFGEGHWTLKAGVLVIASGGVACIDEMDKMNDNDRSAMHEAMEDGVITIHKAGIAACLSAKCAILGAANPKLGRFDPTMISVGEQINLPPTLLSRFDLILTIKDKPDAINDGNIADHILESHCIGERNEKARSNGQGLKELESAAHTPRIPAKLLAKYIMYAKRIYPVMTDATKGELKEYYLSVRKGGMKGAVPITARQLEAMVRLSEASARARLSPVVSTDDAKRAVAIFREYMSRVVGNDIDIVLTGVPSSQRDEVRALLEIVRSLGAADKDGKGAAHEDIIAVAEKEMRMGRCKCDTMLGYMERKEGMIYQPRNGRYAIV